MASTYTTGFGIEKIGTGEQAGAWGTTTNHNADILDRIASYKAVALSGTTHTLTVREASPGSGTENLQDGMYRVIKFTGALGANNTVTIAPNTSPAYFIIENATTDSGSSGPYSVILTQGSGANVTVQNGKNAIIYCDGAGSGAVVYDALADLQVGTLEVTGAAAIDGALTAAAISATTLTASGIVSVDDTTTSTSGTTGSIHTDGGLGVAGTSTLVGVTTHGGNVVSDADSTDSLGTTGVRWAGTWTDAINGVTAPTAQYTSAEETKLSGIEASADVTDATNVLAGLVGQEAVATGFTGTLDGVLGGGSAAAASVTTLTTSGIASIDDTTDTTSGTTGSIHTDGGVGVAKALYVGTTAKIIGVTTHGGNVVSDADSTDDLGTTGVRWANLFADLVYTEGVVFPSTQAASAGANTLDDYEEGTFTPTFTFSTPGDLDVAYSQQVGVYTKVGNRVDIMFNLRTSTFTHSSASGNFAIKTLPFTSRSLTDYAATGAISTLQGVNDTANSTQFAVQVGNASTTLTLRGLRDAGTPETMAVGDLPTGGTVHIAFSLTYFV